jgi:hypothetical protein
MKGCKVSGAAVAALQAECPRLTQVGYSVDAAA